MDRKWFLVHEIDEGLEYIKNYDLDLYNDVLLKFQEIEKNETDSEADPVFIEWKQRKFLGPIVYDVFEKSGVKLELSSNYNDITKCNYILTKEKNVTISGKYELIGTDCFYFSPQVETIVFEDGIQCIDEEAFQNLKNLKTIYLPKTLKQLDNGCFANCTNLENVFFKNTAAQISPSAFEGTKWFDRFTEEFVIIHHQLLKYNGNAKEIIIPEGVKSIGFQVFNENSVIEKVIFPESLEEICVAAFGDCRNLKEVVFQGEKLEIILPMAFYDCTNLKEVTFPKSVKDIGCEAFSQLTKIIFYDNGSHIFEYITEDYPNYEVIE